MKFVDLANMYKAIGDPTRLKIISLLNTRDCYVSEIVALFDISQPAISRHLARLKQVGLVRERRHGMWVSYSLNHNLIQELGISFNELPDFSQELTEI
ncbi:helix-turn-helix transcriptional regulator [Alicyclobacillus sp. SO9]|uniref:ArsR/SmtB family transcription factor n=1 Tax=Alicyclobacillus sp. SO9 TaxID=2665646 RepID=UPI0018E79ED2|nr:metalloregulator ArsR/SmtB family transcription factor [Alicyclobacillus sp. SO9]QQE77755.1 winged helix-turn-helix transcriptional regulator [Alicyclobacillus sp. SO9]